MRALTVHQPWASLLVTGAKPIEWRHWMAPDWIIGERIVIHASAKPVDLDEVLKLNDRVKEEIRLIREQFPRFVADPRINRRALMAGVVGYTPTSLEPGLAHAILAELLNGNIKLPTGAGVGTAIVERTASASDLGYEPGTVGLDSDRLKKQNCGWVMAEPEQWPQAVPMRGYQRLWNWPMPEGAGL